MVTPACALQRPSITARRRGGFSTLEALESCICSTSFHDRMARLTNESFNSPLERILWTLITFTPPLCIRGSVRFNRPTQQAITRAEDHLDVTQLHKAEPHISVGSQDQSLAPRRSLTPRPSAIPPLSRVSVSEMLPDVLSQITTERSSGRPRGRRLDLNTPQPARRRGRRNP